VGFKGLYIYERRKEKPKKKNMERFKDRESEQVLHRTEGREGIDTSNMMRGNDLQRKL